MGESHFCTTNNAQYYTLSSTRGKEPVYAMVVISNAPNHEGKLLYMADKVAKIDDQARVSNLITHCEKLASWLKMKQRMRMRGRADRERFRFHRVKHLIR